MNYKVFLSSWQIIVIIFFCNVSTTVFFVPAAITSYVMQDAWISVVIATFLAWPLLYFPLAHMGKRFPEKTIIQYSEDILGKYAGKLLGFILAYYFFQNHSWSLREFGEITNTFLPGTPMVATMILLASLTAYSSSGGAEVIGRIAQLVFPVVIISMIFIGISNINRYELDNLFPVMEVGFMPLLAASLVPLDWLSIGFVYGMISAYARRKDMIKIGLAAVVLSGLLLAAFSVINIMAFSIPSLSRMTFTFLELSKTAFIPGLERLEVLIVLSWVLGIFIRSAIYAYITVWAVSQLLNLSDYRFLILIESVFSIAFALYHYDNFIEMQYLFVVATLFYLLIYLLLPFILWIISLVRFGFNGNIIKGPE